MREKLLIYLHKFIKKVKLLVVRGIIAYLYGMKIAEKEFLYNIKRAEREVLEDIPARIDTNKTLQLIKSGKGTKGYFAMLKTLTNEDDKEISDWLDISVKTFRSYKNTQKVTKSALTEHVIMLISLFKHGQEIFRNYVGFKQWLEKENYYFDQKAPIKFMDSISGIKFIDDRLTALEFGDNA